MTVGGLILAYYPNFDNKLYMLHILAQAANDAFFQS